MKTIIQAVVTCASMAGAMTCAAELTSRSYVQGGLVAQYDGIDNAGYGVHDASAKVWKDLTGNGNDGICANELSWGEDGWSVSANCKPVMIPAPGLAAIMGKGTFTIQFALTPAIDDKRQAFFSQFNGTDTSLSCYGRLGIEHNDSNDKTGKIRYYKFTSGYPSQDDKVGYLSSASISKEVFTSASVAMSPTVQECCLDGALVDTRKVSLKGLSASCSSVIGGEPYGGNRTGDHFTEGYGMTFQGEYNAFRLYNRTLTEDEAKVNAAVDAIRFKGARPSDFNLGGGWSFDENGNLCVAVTATTDGNGSVSGSTTVEQYSSVTLAATPAPGAVFKCWTGDTGAITSGNAYSPTVTVTAADPVTLTAVFKTPAASSLYVQRGLVAAYDGIDNAGYGIHDYSAKVWKDLSGNGNDGVCADKLSWSADGWSVSTNCKPVTVPAPGLASTFATTNFTMQFACVPQVANKRMCYFGQYATSAGINIEQTVAGKLRFYRNKDDLGQTTAHDKTVSTATVSANTYLSAAVCVSETGLSFYNGGTSLETINGTPGAIASTSASVIGGEVQDGSKRVSLDSIYGITFRGTYHALRVYNVTLTDAEIAWNAGLDAVRFNSADAATTLGDGYSYDAATDTLTATVSATATAGGKISYRGGAAAASVSEQVSLDGSKVVAFSAIPDAGYVFDRWSGDVDLIGSGSVLTPDITIDLSRPVALVANFRLNGDAADGKVFDVSFTGNAVTDGLTFSETGAQEKHGYETARVTLPILPLVTNETVSCLYFPQPTDSDGTGTYRQMAVSDKPAVIGPVATVFCRFRWDGPVLPDSVNYPALILNGYTSWNASRNGFFVRLHSAKNNRKGFFTIVVPGKTVAYNDAGIIDVAGGGYIEPGEWVDCFVSVYPSPTNPTLSNADIWYCRVPEWRSNDDGSYFAAPSIGHRHFGDSCNIPFIDTKGSRLSFGTEPGNPQGVDTSEHNVKCFRGAIAAAKGWNRLLSEGERYTVMAGFEGVQTFNNAETGTGRTVKTENLPMMQGRNVTSAAFLGDTDTQHFSRAMSMTYNTLKLVFDAPKDARTSSYIYKTVISNVKSGSAQPVHLDFNGKTVWSSANVQEKDEIVVELNKADALPGINELTWHYDTYETSNWVQFQYHYLRLETDGMVIILK